MDWAVILNAADARWRVVGLLYLCRERYALNAPEAGRLLALEDGAPHTPSSWLQKRADMRCPAAQP
jgi:hypothetical protein